jgi:hypothetical protein
MNPKLRDVEVHAIEHQGQPMLLLRDPLELGESAIAVPRALAPLLALMDGTRDEAALEAALRVRAGVRLAPGLLARLVADLDTALLLDNERCAAARAAAVSAYRDAPCRPMTVAGSYAADPAQATAALQALVDALPPPAPDPGADSVRGVISPHIDYPRGGRVYAEVWRAAARAGREAELVILLGTDHKGREGSLTPTLQSYATPWGILPTEQDVAGSLIEALGSEAALAEELHHVGEHSIELAAVWLHFVRGGQPVPLLPILCGSFGAFVKGRADPTDHRPFEVALSVLRPVMAGRRTLVVAAADLAHMGPAFGDRYGLDAIARAQLQNADARLLETVHAGDAAAFIDRLRAERDRRHVCGLPPIYLTLRLLDGACGVTAGYAVCPADPQGLSYVSIAGAILY